MQETAPCFATQQDDQLGVRMFVQNVGKRSLPFSGLIEVGNIHVFYDGGILATQLAVRFYERVDIIVGIFSIGIVGRHEKYLLFQFFRGSRVTDEREQKEEGNKENAPFFIFLLKCHNCLF